MDSSKVERREKESYFQEEMGSRKTTKHRRQMVRGSRVG
jgi:hypothetical protein